MTLREDIGGSPVTLVFPKYIAADALPLLLSERAEFEAVFGAPVDFSEDDPGYGPRWTVQIDAALEHNRLEWRREDQVLVSHVRDADGFGSTLQWLHSLVARGVTELAEGPAASMQEAVDRLCRETAHGFPLWADRKSQWEQAVRRYLLEPANASVEDLECVVATLADAHTAIRLEQPVYHPPYAVALSESGAIMRRVPPNTAAYAAGVRAGWRLQIEDPCRWLARVGAPAHARALIAGRRAISLLGVSEREFIASSPAGERVTWVERQQAPTRESILSIDVVASNIVYLHLRNWFTGLGVEEAVQELCRQSHPESTLILDLRGNTGGNLVMAQQIRRHFLRERTLLGTIQFTRGDGTLAEPVELRDEPGDHPRWQGQLVALTDALTYSTSEDFLHGLQGLPHVRVIGQPSGGGSGRPRTISLLPGVNLSMSTALTCDRHGHLIEGHGIPVDVECDPFTEEWRGRIGLE